MNSILTIVQQSMLMFLKCTNLWQRSGLVSSGINLRALTPRYLRSFLTLELGRCRIGHGMLGRDAGWTTRWLLIYYTIYWLEDRRSTGSRAATGGEESRDGRSFRDSLFVVCVWLGGDRQTFFPLFLLAK